MTSTSAQMLPTAIAVTMFKVIAVMLVLTTVQGETPPSPITVNTYGNCASADGTLEKRIQQLESIVLQQQQVLLQLQVARDLDYSTVTRDCTDLFNNGSRSSGIYTIKPAGSKPFQVYCLFDNEGQWTVLQRRTDGSTDFQRSWLEYRNGFGRLGGNHWLGNEYIYAITNQRQYQLRVDIADWDRNRLHATYKYFQIDAEANNYTIHYANYTGTAGDSLTDYHQGMSFSTFDRDNDRAPREHCARLHGGGWWYNECDNGNLNGYYNYDPKLKGPTDQGIEWNSWKQLYSFKETMMRIKPTFDD